MLPLTKLLVETHSSDLLGMDYLFVQGIPFHQSISTGYKFRTIEALRGKRNPNGKGVKDQSKRAIHVYHACGINIRQVNGDNEFQVLTEELRPIPVNIVG